MARHAGAAHPYRFRAVLVPELAADVDHAVERLFAGRGLVNGHFEGTLTGKAFDERHLPQITRVPPDRALPDGDHPETIGARERGEYAAFGNAEYRAHSALAADMQPGIAVAGDDESIECIVRFHQPAQRKDDAFHVSLGLDPERTFGKGGAHNLRPIRKAQCIERRIEIT